MSESEVRAWALQARRSKLQADRQRIQQELGDHLNIRGDLLTYNHKVLKCLKKLLQYSLSSDPEDITRIKVFAFNLYCSKPQIYKHLKSILRLPDERFLENYTINVSPVFKDSALYFLSSKLSSLRPEMNHFVLCIDEIKLNKNFVYDIKRDVILGYHNVNGKMTSHCATKAFIVMLRSIKVNWVHPVAYALTAQNVKTSNAEIATWCVNIISELISLGIQVEAIVTRPDTISGKHSHLDHGINNYFLFNNTKKVYELHDIRYKIKALRDCLIDNDFYMNGTRISWHYIKLLYYHQKDCNETTLVPEITEAHIHPSGGLRSQLKHAAQIFSSKVHHVFDGLINTGALPHESQGTAYFVKIISDLQEVANYSPGMSNKKININYQIKVLENTLEIFHKIQADTSNPPAAIVHMRTTLLAMSKYLRDLKNRGFKRAYTTRLNRAPVDIFFRKVPRVVKDGRRLRPTASQVLSAFSREFIRSLKKRVPAAERRENLAAAVRAGLLDVARAPAAAAMPVAPLRLPFPASRYRIQLSRADNQVNLYLASFLFYECARIHSCPDLERTLRNSEHLFKNYSAQFRFINRTREFYCKLKIPPESFIKYVTEMSNRCVGLPFDSPGAAALRSLRRAPDALPCRCFPGELLLRLFMRMQLWNAVKFNNRRIRDRNCIQWLNGHIIPKPKCGQVCVVAPIIFEK